MNVQKKKILILGDVGVGKTSIIHRYVNNSFSMNYKSTIGVDFGTKKIQIGDNIELQLQFWDVAGSERFDSITKTYYRNADASFIVFDVTRETTLDSVSKWRNILNKHIDPDNSIPVILLANKIELLNDSDNNQIPINEEKMNKTCQKYAFVKWIETSAKENIGITTAINELINCLCITSESNLNDRENNTISMIDTDATNTTNTTIRSAELNCC